MADILTFPTPARTPCAPAFRPSPEVEPPRRTATPTAQQLAASRSTERVADVLLAIEALRSPRDFHLQAIRETGDPDTAICMRASGGLWWLTPAEAREVAAALRADRAFFGCDQVALAFERVAVRAESMDLQAAQPGPAAETQPGPYELTPRRVSIAALMGAVLYGLIAFALGMSAG